MSDPVLITEILRRADAGVSVNPFICRTSDSREIYVKPAGTLPESLVNEWIGSSLAREMELPVADFTLVEIPEMLVKAVIGIDTSGLEAGIGFGSYDVGTGCRDMEASDLDRLPETLLAEILAFDFWINNGDRTLSYQGGNPNLVIGADQDNGFLIDHDNAFDPHFDLADIKNYHLGWNRRAHWLCPTERDLWEVRALAASEKINSFWNTIPESWIERSTNLSENHIVILDSICATLKKPFAGTNNFWKALIAPSS